MLGRNVLSRGVIRAGISSRAYHGETYVSFIFMNYHRARDRIHKRNNNYRAITLRSRRFEEPACDNDSRILISVVDPGRPQSQRVWKRTIIPREKAPEKRRTKKRRPCYRLLGLL